MIQCVRIMQESLATETSKMPLEKVGFFSQLFTLFKNKPTKMGEGVSGERIEEGNKMYRVGEW